MVTVEKYEIIVLVPLIISKQFEIMLGWFTQLFVIQQI